MPMTEVHRSSSTDVAEAVCLREGHNITYFNLNNEFRCTKCGLSLDEIRKGEINR